MQNTIQVGTVETRLRHGEDTPDCYMGRSGDMKVKIEQQPWGRWIAFASRPGALIGTEEVDTPEEAAEKLLAKIEQQVKDLCRITGK